MRTFEDGFDNYGTDLSNMLDGIYASARDISLSTTHVATGTHAIYINGFSPNNSSGGLRKVLPVAVSKVGVAAKFYFASLPIGNTSAAIFDFLSGDANRSQVCAFVDTNGCIRFYKDGNYTVSGEVGTLIAQTDPIIVASAFNHIEIQVYSHATLGWVRVAVNGVHKFQATGLDTYYDNSGIVSICQTQPYYGTLAGIYVSPFWMDDYYIYDFTGTAATDTDFCPTVDGSGIGTNYIGEFQVMWLPPNGNTAEDDWKKSTGTSAFALIDEVDPNDADYIYSDTVGDLTEVSLTDLPPEITYIRGLTVWGRMSKADAGVAMTKFGMKSTTDITDAAERPVTVEPTVWRDMVNVDPDSGARWTRASLNAAWLRLTRSV